MIRPLAMCALFLAPALVLAQTAYDPQVAYVQISGKTQSVYLANADGSHVVRAATASGNAGVLDFAPGGGRIAFSDAQGIKVVAYTASNGGVAFAAPTLLVAGGYNTNSPDFSPDGTRIIYRDGNAQSIRAVAAAGGAPVDLYPGNCGRPRWLRAELGSAFACFRTSSANGTVTYEIWTVLLDDADQVVSAGPVLSTATQAFKAIEDYDVARTRNALLLTVNYPTTMRTIEYDVVTGAITDRGMLGTRPHFSSDDSRIVGLSPHLASGDYVDSVDVASGYVTHLTKKGSWATATDARP